MSRTTIRYVSAIARALHHKCAPTPDQEAQAQNLQELAEMMARNNTLRNVRRPHRESARWIVGLNYLHELNLIHTTANNRLKIEATDKRVDLDVWAGAVDNRYHPDGSIVTTLRLIPQPDGPPTVIILTANVDDNRLDRLEPLVKIDRELGGVIKEHLLQKGGIRFIDSHLCSQLLPAWKLYDPCTACHGVGISFGAQVAAAEYWGSDGMTGDLTSYPDNCPHCEGTGVEPTTQTTQVV